MVRVVEAWLLKTTSGSIERIAGSMMYWKGIIEAVKSWPFVVISSETVEDTEGVEEAGLMHDIAVGEM